MNEEFVNNFYTYLLNLKIPKTFDINWNNNFVLRKLKINNIKPLINNIELWCKNFNWNDKKIKNKIKIVKKKRRIKCEDMYLYFRQSECFQKEYTYKKFNKIAKKFFYFKHSGGAWFCGKIIP